MLKLFYRCGCATGSEFKNPYPSLDMFIPAAVKISCVSGLPALLSAVYSSTGKILL